MKIGYLQIRSLKRLFKHNMDFRVTGSRQFPSRHVVNKWLIPTACCLVSEKYTKCFPDQGLLLSHNTRQTRERGSHV